MFVMKLTTRHDVKQFVMTSKIQKSSSLYEKHVMTSPSYINDYPWVINDYEFSTKLVTLTLDLFLWYFHVGINMSIYSL